MANESLNIPVKDFIQKCKIYFFGFITPIGILLVLFFSAPIFLVGGIEWKKSDLLILEVRTFLTEKQIQISSDLVKKKRAHKILLVLDENLSTSKFIGIKENYSNEIKSAYLRNGISEDKILFLKFDGTKLANFNGFGKELAKFLVTESVKSALIQTGEFQSSRYFSAYKSVLNPLGIEVTIYPEKSKFSSTNWFNSEEGIETIAKETIKKVYYSIKGYK